MYAFLYPSKPLSINANRKKTYSEGLINAFKKYHPQSYPFDSYLYGFVYYFHKQSTGLDADNLSKPVWDALKSLAFVDDKLVRFRSAGTYNLHSDSIEVLDLSTMPDYLLNDFLEMIERESHILYIEVGSFDHHLFHFGYEKGKG